MAAITSSDLRSISSGLDQEKAVIKELKRFPYTNPLHQRDEFVLFYEENGKLKADTYSKRWNAVINRDIEVFLFCAGGVKYNIKDLSLEEGREILNDFDDNTAIDVLSSSKGNAISLELV